MKLYCFTEIVKGDSTMQYSVGVEYAFHSLFYLVDLREQKTIGIREIARLHGITETYLSKIFAKLRKAGIVRSASRGATSWQRERKISPFGIS
jgi:DNA-binding MarR family transcriptional regulator